VKLRVEYGFRGLGAYFYQIIANNVIITYTDKNNRLLLELTIASN